MTVPSSGELSLGKIRQELETKPIFPPTFFEFDPFLYGNEKDRDIESPTTFGTPTYNTSSRVYEFESGDSFIYSNTGYTSDTGSWEFYYYPSSSTAFNTSFSIGQDTTEDNRAWLDIVSTRCRFYMRDNGSNLISIQYDASGNWTVGDWNHIVVNKTAAGGNSSNEYNLEFWMNNIQLTSSADQSSTSDAPWLTELATSDSNVGINGQLYSNNSTPVFTSTIKVSRAAFYKNTLSSTQISDHYNELSNRDGNTGYNSGPYTGSSTSLSGSETGLYAVINTASPSYPNGIAPFAMSEWYSYDHAASAASLPSGYLMYYDYGNTSCYPGSGTTVTDLGTAGANGTIVGAGFTHTPGTSGYMDVTGGSAYIEIPTNSNLQSALTNNFTYIWVVKDVTIGGSMLHNGNPTSFNDPSGTPELNVFSLLRNNISSGNVTLSAGNQPDTTTAWRVMGITKSGGTWRWYVDGSNVETDTLTSFNYTTYSQKWLIWRRPRDYTSFLFSGKQAAFVVYNSVLSASDMSDAASYFQTRY